VSRPKRWSFPTQARVGGPIYETLQPVYTEYNIGHFRRSFSLAPNSVHQEKIMAEMKDGVLTLTLPKAEQAARRRIKVE
jgi:HSP20 family protein